MTLWIGVDISKKKFDVCFGPEGSLECFKQPEELSEFVEMVGQEQDPHVVMESTGGYERALRYALHAEGIRCSVINPARARHFMRSLGKHAKTDPIDARLLAVFGERMKPPATGIPKESNDKLKQLVQRRQQVVLLRRMEKSHLERVIHASARASIVTMIGILNEEIESLDLEIEIHIRSDEELKMKAKRLRTVPGVGPGVASALLAHLPELGTLTKVQAAALPGLAPYVADSGQHKGKRKIRGGRKVPRKFLYMAALVAAHHNPTLKPVYARLLKKGKPKKLALIAIARKLVVILNAMLKTDSDWTLQSENCT